MTISADRLERSRHDLKNVFFALRSGCMLVEAQLGADGSEEVREILKEMRVELERGGVVVNQLRDFDPAEGESGGASES